MNEFWIYHCDVETKISSEEWTYPGLPSPKKFKMQPSAGKVLLILFQDSEGEILVYFLKNGATITGAYNAELNVKLCDLIDEKKGKR